MKLQVKQDAYDNYKYHCILATKCITIYIGI